MFNSICCCFRFSYSLNFVLSKSLYRLVLYSLSSAITFFVISSIGSLGLGGRFSFLGAFKCQPFLHSELFKVFLLESTSPPLFCSRLDYGSSMFLSEQISPLRQLLDPLEFWRLEPLPNFACNYDLPLLFGFLNFDAQVFFAGSLAPELPFSIALIRLVPPNSGLFYLGYTAESLPALFFFNGPPGENFFISLFFCSLIYQ